MNVAHFMLQCDMNSPASHQLECPRSGGAQVVGGGKHDIVHRMM